jgi:hypothetical protein
LHKENSRTNKRVSLPVKPDGSRGKFSHHIHGGIRVAQAEPAVRHILYNPDRQLKSNEKSEHPVGHTAVRFAFIHYVKAQSRAVYVAPGGIYLIQTPLLLKV